MIFTWINHLTDWQLIVLATLAVLVLYAVVMVASSFGRRL